MSTRSATIIRQTTYYTEMDVNTEELMRFYRHCDGYPEGHGLDLARSIALADKKGIDSEYWVQGLLEFFFCNGVGVEFEPYGCEHGDIEFLYVIDGVVDYRWGRKNDGTLPIIISVYCAGFNEPYYEAIKREPIFSGTAYEYIEKFGE